jgi:hypothetical protein
MQEPKQYQVSGWVRRTDEPKDSDGVRYPLGDFDTLRDAEGVRREHLRAGWGHVEILDSSTGQMVPVTHWADLL